jgi:hypothetical protein
MVDLRRAVYTKEFEYDNIDGSKGSIKLLPLTMDYLPFLFSLSKKFKEGMTGEQISEAMDDNTIKGIIDMCKYTIKRSLPSASEEDINDFVIQHWSNLFPLITELNTARQKI